MGNKKILRCLMVIALWGSLSMAVVMFCSGTAGAQVFTGTFTNAYLKQNTFPSGLNEEKVFLDAAQSSTITGHVGSQTNPRLVTFSSTTDVLDAANGFATIKSANDDFINNITITAPGFLFEDLIFSVNLAPNANNNLTVTAMDKSGGTDTYSGWTSLANWVNGENRILLLSTAGNLMKSVTIDSTFGLQSLGGIDQLKQTQISGLTSATSVPEPSLLLLLGLGLMGLAGLQRKLLR